MARSLFEPIPKPEPSWFWEKLNPFRQGTATRVLDPETTGTPESAPARHVHDMDARQLQQMLAVAFPDRGPGK